VHPEAGDDLFCVSGEEKLIVALFGAVRDLAKADCSGSAGFEISEGFAESAMFQADGFYVLRSPAVDRDQVGSGRCPREDLEVGTAYDSGRACP
jgi:hypothetical protein